ncbi:MAG TPA: hypothetical protein VN577_06625 [Terriglobales bacterium]|nr:hypothetical protein [Terriglobales bacterium]
MKTFGLTLFIATALLLAGCGSEKTFEGMWSASLTPTTGSSAPMSFNMTADTNQNGGLTFNTLTITSSNGCITTSAQKAVSYDAGSRTVTFYITAGTNGVAGSGTLAADARNVTGTYVITGEKEECQGSGTLTMKRLENSSPRR